MAAAFEGRNELGHINLHWEKQSDTIGRKGDPSALVQKEARKREGEVDIISFYEINEM